MLPSFWLHNYLPKCQLSAEIPYFSSVYLAENCQTQLQIQLILFQTPMLFNLNLKRPPFLLRLSLKNPQKFLQAIKRLGNLKQRRKKNPPISKSRRVILIRSQHLLRHRIQIRPIINRPPIRRIRPRIWPSIGLRPDGVLALSRNEELSLSKIR